jgi:hypothetical protein
LWTPRGEHRVEPGSDDQTASDEPSASTRTRAGAPAAGPIGVDDIGPEDIGPGDIGPEEQARQLQELRRQIVGTPAEIVVANHVYGLFELAAIHLSEQPPDREQARLAVDAMGVLLEGLAGRLGEAEPSLRDALAQIRLVFVQLGAGPEEDGAGS